MRDKLCLVTGATSGIGAATAEALVDRGATVVLVGRNRASCEAAVERLRSRAGKRSADCLVGDLSLRSDVFRLAREFHEKYERLDVLVNNASAIFIRRQETSEGIEATIALNLLAYFLLTNLLLDRLKAAAPARVVNVASGGHFLAERIKFEDLQGRESYRGMKAYLQSKLGDVMLTYEMARRLEGTGVAVNALDPGMVSTNIGRNNGWVWRFGKLVFDCIYRPNYVSAAEGARTVVYLATANEVEGITGKYFLDERQVASSPASYDLAAAGKLWALCEELTGINAG